MIDTNQKFVNVVCVLYLIAHKKEIDKEIQVYLLS